MQFFVDPKIYSKFNLYSYTWHRSLVVTENDFKITFFPLFIITENCESKLENSEPVGKRHVIEFYLHVCNCIPYFIVDVYNLNNRKQKLVYREQRSITSQLVTDNEFYMSVDALVFPPTVGNEYFKLKSMSFSDILSVNQADVCKYFVPDDLNLRNQIQLPYSWYENGLLRIFSIPVEGKENEYVNDDNSIFEIFQGIIGFILRNEDGNVCVGYGDTGDEDEEPSPTEQSLFDARPGWQMQTVTKLGDETQTSNWFGISNFFSYDVQFYSTVPVDINELRNCNSTGSVKGQYVEKTTNHRTVAPVWTPQTGLWYPYTNVEATYIYDQCRNVTDSYYVYSANWYRLKDPDGNIIDVEPNISPDVPDLPPPNDEEEIPLRSYLVTITLEAEVLIPWPINKKQTLTVATDSFCITGTKFTIRDEIAFWAGQNGYLNLGPYSMEIEEVESC